MPDFPSSPCLCDCYSPSFVVAGFVLHDQAANVISSVLKEDWNLCPLGLLACGLCLRFVYLGSILVDVRKADERST